MIVVVDYGMANLGSILNMFRRLGVEARATGDAAAVAAATRLILPGVGAFDQAMQRLHELRLLDVLNRRALEDRIPILGICLGMQLLTRGSEEGRRAGLGWIPAEARRFRFGQEHGRLRVPHMGWNTLLPTGTHPLLSGLEVDARFYFVHSYYVRCDDPKNLLGETVYGDRFAACIAQGNVLGAQFHPEKSHRFGMRLLKNFAALC